MTRIAIIGLGLIGGSLGLALKRSDLDELTIVGYDTDWDVNKRARKIGAIDEEARDPDPAVAVKDAGIVVIATPISQVVPTLQQIAPALDADAIVTDTASTKAEIVRRAVEILPDSANFVGGHPMAGKEASGIDAAEASLFEDRPWAITPSLNASERAIQSVENLARVTGAEPLCIDAEEHDSYTAAVSHLPLMAATALFSLASGSQAWPELAALAGPGFRDTTRLASTNPELSVDISTTNRQNLVHWLDRYIEALRNLRNAVSDDARRDELQALCAKARDDRETFLRAPPTRKEAGSDARAASPGEHMRSFMFGEYVTRRTKEIEERMKGDGGADPGEAR